MTTVQFPREPDDALYEYLAEKARVCGGGADEIWEGLCTRFGLQPAAEPEAFNNWLHQVVAMDWDLDGVCTKTQRMQRMSVSEIEAAQKAWTARGTLMALPAAPELEDLSNADNAQQALVLLDFALGFALCNMDHSGTRRDVQKAQRHLEAYREFTAPQKYDDSLLPFLALMRAELHANSHKGDREGWLRMSLEGALDEIRHHCDKLIVPVMNHDREAIREHAADVANCAMMLADIAGVLSRE